MTYEELMKIEYSKGEKSGEARGREQGREEERGKMLLLISKMSTDGLSEDIPRLSTDEEFLQKMLQKYQL